MPTAPPMHKRFRVGARGGKKHSQKPGRVLATCDARWRRMRKAVLTDNPLCVVCKESGVITPAVDVDHINGRADRWQDYKLSNLQGLCRSCHSRKTVLEDGGFGTGLAP